MEEIDSVSINIQWIRETMDDLWFEVHFFPEARMKVES
jgi:hypothetical protein